MNTLLQRVRRLEDRVPSPPDAGSTYVVEFAGNDVHYWIDDTEVSRHEFERREPRFTTYTVEFGSEGDDATP